MDLIKKTYEEKLKDENLTDKEEEDILNKCIEVTLKFLKKMKPS